MPSPSKKTVNNVLPHKQRLTPTDIHHEQCVLGSVILRADTTLDQALEVLDSNDFYVPKHHIIFKVIEDLHNRGEHIDVGIVIAELKQRGELENVGHAGYVVELTKAPDTPAHIKTYAKKVKNASMLRQLLTVSEELSALVYSFEGDELDSILNKAEKRIYEIATQHSTSDFETGHKLVDSVFKQLEYQRDIYDSEKDNLLGLPSGFIDLDNLTAGWQKGDLIIFAARPSMGKTSIGLNMAYHNAVHKNIPVAIVSLEMSKDQLVQRFIASAAKVDMKDMRRGALRDEKSWGRVKDAYQTLVKAPIYMTDYGCSTVLQIESKLRRLASEDNPPQLVLIDYLQLIQGNNKENRTQQLSEITNALKRMAHNLQIPVIVISQLSRACELRDDKRPILSDLRESGSIEQDADVVVFPFREAYYNRANGPQADETEAELIVAKQRNGPVGTIRLHWDKEWATFRSAASYRDERIAKQTAVPEEHVEDLDSYGSPAPYVMEDDDPFNGT